LVILYLDCAGGASGDMLTAALCALAVELGLDGRRVVREALESTGIDPAVAAFGPQPRGGMDALGFAVEERSGFHTFSELQTAVAASSLPESVKERVISAAGRMAAAEALVHGSRDAHLHELAGIDTAVDLVAACALMVRLAPGHVVAAPPALGSGWVPGGHGMLSVPTPAVLALLTGLPTAGGGDLGSGELTTPTGAALLAELADEFGSLPAGRVAAVGVGSGSREIDGRANVLRAVAIEPLSAGGPDAPTPAGEATYAVESEIAVEESGGLDDLVLLETTVDDLSPEYLAVAVDALRAAGARDAWLTPVLMKKGRPGATLHVLAEPTDADRLARLVFAETTTFGVRIAQVRRLRMDERFERVDVDGEAVGVRLGYLGGRLLTASPELEDCRRAGERLRLPARRIHERAQALARERFGDT
jgi:uncharacterized protein (TIGR00299 family) protein